VTTSSNPYPVLTKEAGLSSSTRGEVVPGSRPSSNVKKRALPTVKAWLFLLPTFAFIGTFAYWPAGRALVGAFTNWDGVSAPQWVGFQNFVKLFHDSVFLGSFEHLFWWTIIGIPIGMGASLLVALLIYRLPGNRAQYWFRVAFSLTLCLPGIVGILTWYDFYQIGGVIDVILNDVGLGSLSTSFLANPHTALGTSSCR
jgi:multiple sugar transport system permease protein